MFPLVLEVMRRYNSYEHIIEQYLEYTHENNKYHRCELSVDCHHLLVWKQRHRDFQCVQEGFLEGHQLLHLEAEHGEESH